MKKNICVLILLALTPVLYTQDIRLDFEYQKHFYWTDSLVSDKEDLIKKSFLNQIDVMAELFITQYKINELKKDLHLMDINNDGFKDIIYDAKTDFDARIISIYIQTPTGFQRIFQDQQEIMRLDFNNNILEKIYIRDSGCCADPSIRLKTFSISFTDSISCVKDMEIEYLNTDLSFFPDSLSLTPKKKFMVLGKNLILRSSPVINDVEYNMYEEDFTGNRIGKIKLNTISYVLSEFIDINGQKWFFSIFPTKILIKSDIFLEDEFPFSWYLGWINADKLKIID